MEIKPLITKEQEEEILRVSKHIQEARSSYDRFVSEANSMLVKIPKIDMRAFKPLSSDIVTKGLIMPHDSSSNRDEWKRHEETMNTQNTLLQLIKQLVTDQSSIAKGQKADGTLTKFVFFFTLIQLIVSTIALVDQFNK